MKRLLPLLLFLFLILPARADVLWSPVDNQFFDRHYRDFDYVGRSYYANGPRGYVTLWKSPGGATVVHQYENGEVLYVFYQYKDWVLIGDWPPEEELPEDAPNEMREISGWTPLADLSVIYDRISFEEDYAGAVRDYGGEVLNYDGDFGRINFYEYPGAPEVKRPFEFNDVFLQDLEQQGSSVVRFLDENASRCFTDEDGRTWIYVDRIYEPIQGWFCLEDPAGTGFPVREIPETVLTPAQPPRIPAMAYTPYILVAGVLLVTAGLLFWFYGRRRKDASGTKAED